ncbi:MAG: class I SAM-dependent DNA methyltransferase, partial [Gammaproteobacteria bacterium]|nr:class I SAM-dependent DNA methyltransferase [Gammaproteobacteria bacterium]
MLDLTGINNDNDFYSHHYLSAILEGDLKGIFSQWQDQEQHYKEQLEQRGDKADTSHPDRASWIRLRAQGQLYLQIRNQLDSERSVSERVRLQRQLFRQLLQALGYDWQPKMQTLDNGSAIPLLASYGHNGHPQLWILGALDASRSGENPLSLSLNAAQFLPEWIDQGNQPDKTLLQHSFDDLISKQLFSQEQPPRWIILLSDSQLLLIDRQKWGEKRLLRFDLSEIYGRKEESTFKATAALLTRSHLLGEGGSSLLDSLDENAHKHAYGVSEDLKYALRESIELLGNELMQQYQQSGSGERKYSENRAADLSRQCLRYMYRLLFLFYLESHPELGYVPMNSNAYRKGYSLESLRDLELMPLESDEAQNGSYLFDTLQLLFGLINDGFRPDQQQTIWGGDAEAFTLAPLASHLFANDATPLFSRYKIRNQILQRVIQLMSLSRPKAGKKSRRGRISYAQLGINQLGAVYEALLSYKGFFAKTDLYEVKPAKEPADPLATAYFVTEAELPNYSAAERVLDEEGEFKRYPQGTFIYRMSGRDRQSDSPAAGRGDCVANCCPAR